MSCYFFGGSKGQNYLFFFSGKGEKTSAPIATIKLDEDELK